MSEKRFTGAVDSNGLKSIFDNESEDCNEPILFNCIGIVDKVVDLLNDQDKTIKGLQSELDLVANFKVWSRRKLEEDNEQLRKQLEKIPKNIREVWLED